ncbi:FIG00732074: hypothetical protein [Klebsiella pneumoniae IS53]|nr:FIG00732074: hypothetical protein [Klebsiella pneumoniae IS53]
MKAVNASGESAFFLAVDHARSAETITTWPTPGRTPAWRINPAPHR